MRGESGSERVRDESAISSGCDESGCVAWPLHLGSQRLRPRAGGDDQLVADDFRADFRRSVLQPVPVGLGLKGSMWLGDNGTCFGIRSTRLEVIRIRVRGIRVRGSGTRELEYPYIHE